MSYIAFAWLTTLVYGLGSVIGKISTKYQIRNPWLFNMLWVVLTALCILPFALFAGVGLPKDWISMLWLGVANAVAGILFVLAFYAVDLSILSPLSMVRAPLIALAGMLFLGEILTTFQWISIMLIFIAGLFVNIDESFSIKSIFSKKILLAGAWILSSVWFNSMIKYASVHNGFWEVSLWSTVISAVIFLPTIPLFYNDIKKTPAREYVGIVLMIIFYTAGLLFSFKAFGENVGISMAIISLPLAMVITIGLSFFAPQLLEKHTPKVYAVRFIAAAVMFAGALGLSR